MILQVLGSGGFNLANWNLLKYESVLKDFFLVEKFRNVGIVLKVQGIMVQCQAFVKNVSSSSIQRQI